MKRLFLTIFLGVLIQWTPVHAQSPPEEITSQLKNGILREVLELQSESGKVYIGAIQYQNILVISYVHLEHHPYWYYAFDEIFEIYVLVGTDYKVLWSRAPPAG
jgi:hypothetical protein